ncbi:MAG TPA: hypothetical protein DCM87_05190 [Planctomycetes bacterium]|nr:hypothetical protein [Planctomycetota bacterium]
MHLPRRSFFRAGAAAAAFGSFARIRARGNEDRIRVGFVGIGGRGSHHLRTVMSFPFVDVAAVCDIREEACARAQSALVQAGREKPAAYDDYRKLLERADLDSVVNATPPDCHARQYLDTLAAGKDLYGEKPMCITPEECDAVVAAAEKSKNHLLVGFQGRYSPRNREGVRRIHAGDLGEVMEMHSAYLASFGPLRGWQSTRARSGDWAVEQAVHFFDLMNWLFKGTAAAAFGWGRKDVFTDGEPGRDVTDYYAALLKYPGGVIVNWQHSWLRPKGGVFDGVRHQVLGRKGGIDLEKGIVNYTDAGRAAEQLPADGGDPTKLAHADLFECIRSGKTPFSNAVNGRDSVLVALLVREAADRGACVTFEELFGRARAKER